MLEASTILLLKTIINKKNIIILFYNVCFKLVGNLCEKTFIIRFQHVLNVWFQPLLECNCGPDGYIFSTLKIALSVELKN